MSDGVDVKWWSSSTVVEIDFLLGLDMHSLGGVGCTESVDFVFWR